METVKRWLRTAEAQLDSWGRPGWIGAMVLGFILVWPVGLAILFYMLWSGRMGCHSRGKHRWGRKAFQPTGNSAFDAYREETLKRLEEEQTAFQEFLGRLRRARDQAEFDQFLDERRRPSSPTPEPAA